MVLFPMRIAFLDLSGFQFTVDTPYERPMGGSQSALCYLAVELAGLGHEITIFNNAPSSSDSGGVQIEYLERAKAPGTLNRFDVIVVLNLAIGRALRHGAAVTKPIVLWTGHAHDQQAILALKEPNERKKWTGFAFVSDWQRGCYEKAYSIPREKGRVLRNAISPAFANLLSAENQLWFNRGEAPVLFYTSTPFRGLDVLLNAFPTIRQAIPGTRLRVFSSMSVYQVQLENDPYRELYSQCQSMDGVEYVGSIGQSQLARELAGAAALAYPSTFAETSCIVVLEAMATGAAVLTTHLGAIPETTNGLASMVGWQLNKAQLSESFAAMTIKALRGIQENPAEAAARRRVRMKFILNNYLWPARAKEWSEWLSSLASRSSQRA
jgi:glycosyltransferase involved in cell wall biosynthesis